MSRRPSSIYAARRGSSLGLIPEDQPPVTYEQSSGRTYVVQHLRGNAVVVRRTSSGGISDGRPGLASQPWDRRASLSSNTYTQPSTSSDWSSAAQTMPLRRASAQMSPLQMLPPPTSLPNMAGSPPSPSTSIRRPSWQPTSSSAGSVAGSIHEEEDAEMMDVDVPSPCSSTFSTPNSSPPSSPGIAAPMSYARQSPKSPLRSKMANWLRHV